MGNLLTGVVVVVFLCTAVVFSSGFTVETMLQCLLNHTLVMTIYLKERLAFARVNC